VKLGYRLYRKQFLDNFGCENQHPEIVCRVDLIDANKEVSLNRAFVKIQSREYQYLRPDGSKIVFQEHSLGHVYGPPGTSGNQGPHFNPRRVDPRNGKTLRNKSVEGLYEHYEFPR